MNDLASLAGKGRPLRVGDETFTVAPLTLDDLGDLQAWLEAQYPDPLAYLQERLDGFPVAAQKHLIATALEIASKPRARIGTPEADALIQSVAGIKEVLYLALRRGTPGLTRERVAAIFGGMAEAEVRRLFALTGADAVVEGDPGPKASGASA